MTPMGALRSVPEQTACSCRTESLRGGGETAREHPEALKGSARFLRVTAWLCCVLCADTDLWESPSRTFFIVSAVFLLFP